MGESLLWSVMTIAPACVLGSGVAATVRATSRPLQWGIAIAVVIILLPLLLTSALPSRSLS
jgi:hypothetical protein